MELEIYESDDKEYVLIKEKKIDNIIFCYFVNIKDNNDIIIKKYDKFKNIINISEEELEIAIKNFN